ncbi:MAG: efflux RND transporter periplasmic adaptor subunit, partial [Flammeovirgaceae bacterium]
LKRQLKECTVYAPFDGTIVEKLVDVGGFLEPGTPVARLINNSKLKARVWVGEQATSRLHLGEEVRIRFDAIAHQPIFGKVSFLSPISGQGGKFLVMVEFNNTLNAKAGMTVHAFLQEHETTRVLLVPKSALILNSTTPAVYVLEGNKAKLQPVVLGNSRANQVEVVQGLAVNTTIVAKGVENVVEGMTLNVANRTNLNK